MNTLPKLMLALVILLTVAGVTQTCAQVAPVDDRDINQRSFNLGLLRTGKPSKKTSSKSEDTKVVLAQIQEDFTRIQVIDNELIEALQRTGTVDIPSVMKSAAELNTRAVKLMESLTESKATRNPKTSPELLTDTSKVKDSLYMLDSVIAEFADNKVFKEASPDDDKLAAQALRSLDQIIKLSEQISLSAQKINKSP